MCRVAFPSIQTLAKARVELRAPTATPCPRAGPSIQTRAKARVERHESGRQPNVSSHLQFRPVRKHEWSSAHWTVATSMVLPSIQTRAKARVERYKAGSVGNTVSPFNSDPCESTSGARPRQSGQKCPVRTFNSDPCVSTSAAAWQLLCFLRMGVFPRCYFPQTPNTLKTPRTSRKFTY